MAVFFAPVGVLGGPGNLQSTTTDTARNVSFVRDSTGAASPCPAVSSGLRLGVTEVYQVQALAGFFRVPAVGSISAAGFHVDAVSIAWAAEAWPTVTISGHKHDAPAHGPVPNAYAPTVALPAGWGALPPWCGDGGVSAAYMITATHVEAYDEEGNVFASMTTGGIETAEAETQHGPLTAPAADWEATTPGGAASLIDAATFRAAWQRAFPRGGNS